MEELTTLTKIEEITDSNTETALKDEEEAIESQSASGEHVSVSGTLSHLTSSVPRAAKIPSGTPSKQEIAEMRSIFGNLDDAEIQRLYKRVTK